MTLKVHIVFHSFIHNNLHGCNPTFHSIDSLLVAKRHQIRQPIHKYKIYQTLSELVLGG